MPSSITAIESFVLRRMIDDDCILKLVVSEEVGSMAAGWLGPRPGIEPWDVNAGILLPGSMVNDMEKDDLLAADPGDDELPSWHVSAFGRQIMELGEEA